MGDRRSEINSLAGLVWALFDLAEYERALAVAEDARAVVRGLGAFRYDPLFLMTIGRSLQRLGDRRAGLSRLREAVSAAEASAPPFHGSECHAALAEATDDARERSDSLKRCRALIAAGCVGHGPLRAHPICARVALAIDDDAQARAHLDALSNLAQADTIIPARIRADIGRAALECASTARRAALRDEARSYGLADCIGGF